MGCCLSTKKTPKSNNPHAIPSTHHRNSSESDFNNRAPPSAFEEETVKEVLSETPIVKLPTPVVTENKESHQQIEENKKSIKVEEVLVQPNPLVKPPDDIVSEISEVSEMCSFTESFSTTLTEKKDDVDGEVTQRSTQRIQRSPVKMQKKRQYTGDHAGMRERNVRSPARRSAPSPEKRNQMTSRPVPSRSMTNQRRVIGSPNGAKRDPGEGSGRRSRSPVTRVEVGSRQNARYRSPTATSTSRAGCRSPARSGDYNGGKSPVRKVEYSGALEKENDDVEQQTNESLENPLVSLECFIFL